MTKPVYIINGFLESGKTEFITFTLGQPYFQIKGKTLLILCEEGENEYDPALLKKSRTDGRGRGVYSESSDRAREAVQARPYHHRV